MSHFEISERKILLRILDVTFVWVMLYMAEKYLDFTYFSFKKTSWIWLLTLGFYILLFGTVFEIYNLQKADSKRSTIKNLLLTSLLVTLFFLLTPVLSPPLPQNRTQIVFFFSILILTLLCWRFAYISLIASPRFFKRVLIVGDNVDIDTLADELLKYDSNYEIKGYVSSSQKSSSRFKHHSLKNLESVVHHYKVGEIVVVSSLSSLSSDLYQALIPLLKTGFPIKAYAHVYEAITNKVPVQYVDNDFYFYFPFSRSNHNRLYLLYHRFVDIALSIIGLIFGVFLLPFILLGNFLGNKGSLFYKQVRLGKSGKKFKIMKLRTMIKDAETQGAQFASKGDLRITKFGHFLRRSRLDEVPQFINILKGEMSLIGPRPERPEFVQTLSEKIPFYEVRQVVKPGLTGWAQVNAKYAISNDDMIEKLQYDLYYIKHRSVFLDLRIILKTISTVIFFKGQ